MPLPTKWRLHFGEPLDVAARYAPTAATDTRAVGGLVDQVRERLQGLVVEGLRRRRSIFGRLLMAVVVAVDQGTTGSTVLVFDRRGRVVGRAYSEFTQHYPKPGWVEHDAEEIWRVTLRVLRQACRRARVRARDVAARRHHEPARDDASSGIAAPGRPVHRAIVWQDRRTAPECERAPRPRRGGA